jgi:DNA-binding CsgD family transcriptional regulator
MKTKELSPREEEIVELASEGLTNKAIANRLGLSIGTVNTYWLRIRLKNGGFGRTDAVLNFFKEKAERALDAERIDWEGLGSILAKREISDVLLEKARDLELRTALALLHLAMSHIQSTVWATDQDLRIHYISNGDLPATRFGVRWEDGKTVYEVFNTTDKAHLAVTAHLDALAGSESQQRLSGEFADMSLKVVPVADEFGDVICCISILRTGIE